LVCELFNLACGPNAVGSTGKSPLLSRKTEPSSVVGPAWSPASRSLARRRLRPRSASWASELLNTTMPAATREAAADIGECSCEEVSTDFIAPGAR